MDVLLLSKDGVSEWQSCTSIVSNLRASYQSLAQSERLDIQEIRFSPSLKEYGFYELAKRILERRPQIIAWIDYAPTPAKLIKALHELCLNQQYRPKLMFHLYGDFSLFANEWLGVEDLLRNFSVRFVCASRAQANLVSTLVTETLSVSFIPFPVDSELFRIGPNQETRGGPRLIYTGRISLQKNVLLLLEFLHRFRIQTGIKFSFSFAGEIDDMGRPYVGYSERLLTHSFQLAKALEAYPWATYLGVLQGQELVTALQNADLYVGLSTHNDEDFGMAPAEALLCGLPALLTRWGGFISFSEGLPSQVLLVDLENQRAGPLPSYKDFSKKLFKALNITSSKKNFAELAREYCSLEAVGEKLKVMNGDYLPFMGFTEKMRKLSLRMKYLKNYPFKKSISEHDSLYGDLYEVYGVVVNEGKGDE